MEKIQMTTPLVEMDGDEMTRILWKMIKDELIYPFIDLKSEYYDLGLEYRNETNDQVTFDSAYATQKYGVAVKCATITPNAARMTEYDLKEMWKSPNGTIRAILDGTVFRTPIIVKGIEPCVKNWKAPITIARHAYGDVYKNVEIKVPGAGKAELVFTGADGTVIKETTRLQRRSAPQRRRARWPFRPQRSRYTPDHRRQRRPPGTPAHPVCRWPPRCRPHTPFAGRTASPYSTRAL